MLYKEETERFIHRIWIYYLELQTNNDSLMIIMIMKFWLMVVTVNAVIMKVAMNIVHVMD